MEQLMIYAALYCLQHRIKPYEISIECRIYQAGEIIFYSPTNEEMTDLVNNIVEKAKFIIAVRSGRR
jgi:hypothetical protein